MFCPATHYFDKIHKASCVEKNAALSKNNCISLLKKVLRLRLVKRFVEHTPTLQHV